MIVPKSLTEWTGNSVTADRWAGMLQELGHDVQVDHERVRGAYDLLIALHARKSAGAIQQTAIARPRRPIVVALTGTDVYGDLHSDPAVLSSLEQATRIVVLQPAAASELPEGLRERVRVIYQSVSPPSERPEKRKVGFEVCVIGNLREVKDPFRTAEAAALLPPTSRIRVVHIGAALDAAMECRARQVTESNDRYEWLGPLPRDDAMRRLAGAHLMALTSIMEGGANVVSEAIVYGVPVVSSYIAGSIGLLGEDYPGYFPVGDTDALAGLLHRAETNQAFYESLRARAARLVPRFDPDHERTAWKNLLEEL